MFEQDYIMRQIHDMIRAILKLFFNVDTESPAVELLEERKENETLEPLLELIDEGRIDEAENRLFEVTGDGSKEDLKLALLFYSHLNDKTDGFLEEHDFSREEIKSGLRDMMKKCGVEGFSDIFF